MPPFSLSEETVLRVVASATIHGDHCATTAIGERQAARWMEREGLAVAVCQMDSATLASVREAARRAAMGAGTAHEVALMRASLRTSAVSHILAPCGGRLDRSAEEVARSSEAAAFQLDPGDVADQLFCRPGAAAGMYVMHHRAEGVGTAALRVDMLVAGLVGVLLEGVGQTVTQTAAVLVPELHLAGEDIRAFFDADMEN